MDDVQRRRYFFVILLAYLYGTTKMAHEGRIVSTNTGFLPTHHGFFMHGRYVYDNNEVLIGYPEGFKATNHIEIQHFNKKGSDFQTLNTEMYFEGIKISSSYSSATRNMLLYTEQNYPAIGMFFLLSGSSKVHPTGICSGIRHPDFISLQHNIGYTPSFAGWFNVEHSQEPFRFVDIQLTPEYFERLMRENIQGFTPIVRAIDREQPALLCEQHLPLRPQMQRILNDILSCPHSGYMKKVLMESRVVELLSLQSKQVEQTTQRSVSFTTKDIDKLYAAKHRIEANPLMPPSLLELAHSVGLNDFKLKKGFREVFHTTVFGYANDIRMELAKRMLLDEQKNVSEVADALGYSQPHHFSTAFKKKYGINPSTLAK